MIWYEWYGSYNVVTSISFSLKFICRFLISEQFSAAGLFKSCKRQLYSDQVSILKRWGDFREIEKAVGASVSRQILLLETFLPSLPFLRIVDEWKLQRLRPIYRPILFQNWAKKSPRSQFVLREAPCDEEPARLSAAADRLAGHCVYALIRFRDEATGLSLRST